MTFNDPAGPGEGTRSERATARSLPDRMEPVRTISDFSDEGTYEPSRMRVAEIVRLRVENEAHLTAAAMYKEEADRLRAENAALRLENDRWREWSGVGELARSIGEETR